MIDIDIDKKRAFNTSGIQNRKLNKIIRGMLTNSESISKYKAYAINDKIKEELIQEVEKEKKVLREKYKFNLPQKTEFNPPKDQTTKTDYFVISLLSYIIKEIDQIKDDNKRIEEKIDLILKKL